ncbi:MFS transporter [Saccharopolyspora sp. NPDC050642]|uniref:MFS transporter n=1 Tax=Saccharopolyspora sp. NPDC050642 TaxID=3157099 RepID=UPI0033E3775C
MTIDEQLLNGRNGTAVGRSRTSAWAVVLLCMSFMLINFADKAVIGFAGVQIRQDLGLSAEQFGLVQSAFFWLFAAGAILVGLLTSKISPRWIVVALIVVWTLTLVPLVGAVGFGTLLVCRIILGFAEGPAAALVMSIAHSWFPPDKRALPSGVINAGTSLGPLLAAPTLTWVISAFDWHAAFIVLIAAGLVWLVLWLPFGRMGTERATTVAAVGALPERVPYRVLFTRPTIIGLGLLMFLAYWGTSLKVSWLPLFLREGLGYSATATGYLVTLPYAVGVLANIGFGLLSNWLSARGVSNRLARGWLAAGLVVANGLSMLGFALLGQSGLQMLFVVLGFSLYSAAFAISFAAVSDVVPAKQRGVVFGFVIGFYSLGGVLAPMIMGLFVGAGETPAAGYSSGFTFTGALMAIGCIAAVWLIRPEKDTAELVARYATRG